jgi:U32 family peptidase
MKIQKKKIKYELIAPAGNMAKAKYALKYGADSIYLGIPDFSLRVRINKFDEGGIEEMIDYAHKIGKKVYVTVNIHAHNRHINNLPNYLKQINKWRADGVIVSDPGVITLAKKHCPKVPIHLSTQANCTNWQAAKFWFDLGIKRIVLGREVTLDEIREIKEKVPKLELEYFAHGAMCMSYSGRCLLSSFFVGRSANLGDCVQPCRWEYDYYIADKKRPEKLMKVEEDTQGSYILNSKDLALVKYIEDLKEAGITSFKIEGRAKSVYYVSLISKIYRKALNLKGKKEANKKELNKLFKELQTLTHREYTTGFLFGKEKVEQKYDKSHILTNFQFVGELSTKLKKSEVKKINLKEGRYYKVKVHNELFIGDSIEIIQPKSDKVSIKLKNIYDTDGQAIKEAHGGQEKIIIVKINKDIENMSILRRKI